MSLQKELYANGLAAILRAPQLMVPMPCWIPPDQPAPADPVIHRSGPLTLADCRYLASMSHEEAVITLKRWAAKEAPR